MNSEVNSLNETKKQLGIFLSIYTVHICISLETSAIFSQDSFISLRIFLQLCIPTKQRFIEIGPTVLLC